MASTESRLANHLRHSSFVGLREDKDARDVAGGSIAVVFDKLLRD